MWPHRRNLVRFVRALVFQAAIDILGEKKWVPLFENGQDDF